MSALPAEPAPRPLPRISRSDYPAQGLATVRDLARMYRAHTNTVQRYFHKPNCPRPVAEVAERHYGRHEPLYRITEFDTWILSAENDGTSLANRRPSRPPRLVGVRTPTAGKPYVWRDPARYDG